MVVVSPYGERLAPKTLARRWHLDVLLLARSLTARFDAIAKSLADARGSDRAATVRE